MRPYLHHTFENLEGQVCFLHLHIAEEDFSRHHARVQRQLQIGEPIESPSLAEYNLFALNLFFLWRICLFLFPL